MIARVLTKELADYAKELLAAGFRVYVFTSDIKRIQMGSLESCGTHFGFSRVVDDRQCFGSVSYSLAGYQFHMPIKPSRENGSSMFIGGSETPEFEDLTIANAELYASPTGRNHLVGIQQNYPDGYRSLYTEVTS